MPKPELYIIYTGNRKERPEEISFSKEFFNGENICIEVKAKVIYDGREGDIIYQYVTFTRVCQEQTSIYGRSRKAIQEAIRICKNRNVLKEYLESREKEVIDMMMDLYDQEEVMRSYVKSKEHDTKVGAAKRLLAMGKLSFEEIAIGSGLSVEEVEELAGLQLA